MFQLNSCLWLVYKSPINTSEKQPPYGAAGFMLRAIGRTLATSPDAKTRFKQLGWSPSPPAPDVLFRHGSSHKHLVIECKASSFSVDSSTAKQARKLLALCADPDAASGTKGAAIVAYLISAEDTALQLATLTELTAELQHAEVAVADSGTIGLSIDDEGLWATLTLLTPGKHGELGTPEGPVKVTEGAGEGSRPLYIVPFDPAAFDNQLPHENSTAPSSSSSGS